MHKTRTIKTKSYPKSPTIVLVFLMVLLLGVAVWWFIFRNTDPAKSYQPQYPESVKTELKQGDNKSATAADDYKNSDNTSTPSSETSNQVPLAKTGNIEIKNLNQKDGFVNVLATVSNFETNKCVYIFNATDSRPVVREISGNCSGVSIPQVEFEMIGTYTLTATAYSGSEKITATKDIDVK